MTKNQLPMIPGMIPIETHQRAVQQAIKDTYDTALTVDRFLNGTLQQIIHLCCYIDGLAFALGNVGTDYIAARLEQMALALGDLANEWKLKAPRYGIQNQHITAVFDYADQRVFGVDQLLNYGDKGETLKRCASLPGNIAFGLHDEIRRDYKTAGAKAYNWRAWLGHRVAELKTGKRGYEQIASMVKSEILAIPEDRRTPDESRVLLEFESRRPDSLCRSCYNDFKNRVENQFSTPKDRLHLITDDD